MSLIWFIIIGLVAGWIAGEVTKGHGYGLLGNLIVGILGAILGGYVFQIFGVTAGGLLGQLIMSVVGAIILLLILSAIPIRGRQP